jgi:hypothetical protein
MSEHHKTRVTDTTAQAIGHAHVGRDLLALLGVLVFAAGFTLLVDRTGQLSARLGFAGAAGLVASCMTAWRRLRQPGPRHWRSGQVIYHGRRMMLVSSWGVEGQPPPAIEPLASAAKDTDGLTGPVALPTVTLSPDSED